MINLLFIFTFQGITVDSLKSEDLTDVSETIFDLWNVSVDSRHSDQMHRYLIFAICSTIPEGALDLENPVLLPFSRQKVFISLPLAFHLIRINGKLATSLEVREKLSCLTFSVSQRRSSFL